VTRKKVDLEALVQETDLGGRTPSGVSARIVAWTCLAWSLVQLWYASPLPFAFNVFVLNSTEMRSLHLGIGLFLAYLAFPFAKRSPRKYIPAQDWVLAVVAAFCGAYLFLFYREISTRPGEPTMLDMVSAVVGMLLLLEATRRALGPPLAIIAILMLGYAFAGPYMPDVVAHKGVSLSKAVSHYWLTTEGVFGVALGVSRSACRRATSSCSCCSARCSRRRGRATTSSRSPSRCSATCAAARRRPRSSPRG